MSGISPGSRSTTSLFMVVTLLTLAALVWRGSQKDAGSDPCFERLVKIDAVVAAEDVSAPVTISFALRADGTVDQATVLSDTDPRDTAAMTALSSALFSPGEEDTCVFHFPADS